MVGLFVVGKWQGSVKIKMWFTAGGAIEFGQAMLRAGQLGIMSSHLMLPMHRKSLNFLKKVFKKRKMNSESVELIKLFYRNISENLYLNIYFI